MRNENGVRLPHRLTIVQEASSTSLSSWGSHLLRYACRISLPRQVFWFALRWKYCSSLPAALVWRSQAHVGGSSPFNCKKGCESFAPSFPPFGHCGQIPASSRSAFCSWTSYRKAKPRGGASMISSCPAPPHGARLSCGIFMPRFYRPTHHHQRRGFGQ